MTLRRHIRVQFERLIDRLRELRLGEEMALIENGNPKLPLEIRILGLLWYIWQILTHFWSLQTHLMCQEVLDMEF